MEVAAGIWGLLSRTQEAKRSQCLNFSPLRCSHWSRQTLRPLGIRQVLFHYRFSGIILILPHLGQVYAFIGGPIGALISPAEISCISSSSMSHKTGSFSVIALSPSSQLCAAPF